MADAPSWSEIGQLHVVRSVAKLLARRWRLGLGFVSAEATSPPGEGDFADGPSLCPLIQGHAQGHASCTGTTRSLWQRLCAEDNGAIAACECHAGLIELAAPVRAGGRLVGALVCGGFVRESAADQALARIDRRLRPLELPRAELQAARAHRAVLSPSDEAFVGELLADAADEIHALFTTRVAPPPPAPTSVPGFDQIVGGSPAMRSLYSILERVVSSDSTVLIQGENGTGKELVARAVHRRSARRDQRFVVQNCSAFNDNLLDSELFGHKRGAFTGAVVDKPGLFEVADGGTFFLDEIGDMSPVLQVKVLRVLQEGTFTPVGDTVERQVDVRIIAATNRDLKAMVARGEFREDLYYRINVIGLEIPPLRARRGDIPLLVDTFLTRHATSSGGAKSISDDAVRQLESYPWPGNVRELENEIERAVVLSGTRPTLEVADLSERVRGAPVRPELGPDLDSLPLPLALRTLERRMILAALERTGWNKTRAAAELEISRRNLIRLVQKYELESERSA